MGDIKTISEIIIFEIQFRITLLTIYKKFTIIQILSLHIFDIHILSLIIAMKIIQKLLNNYENKFNFHLNICCCFLRVVPEWFALILYLNLEGIQEDIHVFKI